MAELKPFRGDYYLWHYLPSIAAAAIFTVIFALLTIALLWRMCKTRTWYFTAFIIGGLCEYFTFRKKLAREAAPLASLLGLHSTTDTSLEVEVIGFAARASAHDKTDRLMPFVIQNTYILLAPALFAATIYMMLGRLIRRCGGEAYSLVPIRWLTKLFVLGDVLSFTVQGGAAGLMAVSSLASMGTKIVVVGLFIQIIVFGFFIITTIVFEVRMNRNPTVESQDPATTWRQHVYTLYFVSVLIMIRSIFRAVEFIQGYDGYLLQNEWPMYVFDTVLMFFVMAIFVWRYPTNLVMGKKKEGSMPLSSF